MKPPIHLRAILIFLLASAAATVAPDVARGQEAVVPFVECIEVVTPQLVTFHFGYHNPNPEPVSFPLGILNGVIPQPFDRGQPTTFLPGVHEHVFSATISPGGPDDDEILWFLGPTQILTATLYDTPRCAPDPAPIDAASCRSVSRDGGRRAWVTCDSDEFVLNGGGACTPRGASTRVGGLDASGPLPAVNGWGVACARGFDATATATCCSSPE